MGLPAGVPVLAALVCVVATWIILKVLRPEKKYKNLPPGKLEWPLGSLQILKEGFTKFFDYDDGVPRKHRVFGSRAIALTHPEHVKFALNSDTGSVDSSGWGLATRTLLGPLSVVMSSGPYHRMLRRLLGPAFTWQAVETYIPGIQLICERYCAAWAEASAEARVVAAAAGEEEGGGGGGGPGPGMRLDVAKLPRMQKEVRLLTFEVIAHVVAGFRFTPAQLAQLSDAFDTLMRGLFSPLPLALPGTRYGRATAARRVIVRALNQQVDMFKAAAPAAAPPAAAEGAAGADAAQPDQHQHQDQDQGGGPLAAPSRSPSGDGGSPAGGPAGSVIEQLVRHRGPDGEELGRQALEDIGINLLFAGHETSATTLIRLLMRLRSAPDIVARLRAEQREAVEKHGDQVTGAALRDMPYLDAVVKETFRTDSVVPFLPRRAARDLQLGGYDVPKGWTLLVAISATVRHAPSLRGLPEGDPLHPHVFNPDRWLLAAPGAGEPPPGSGLLSSPPNMLPGVMNNFGSGLRYCLGANLAWVEIKTFLCVLFRRYDIHAPLEHMELRTFPAVTVTEGFPLQVFPTPVDTVAAA